MLASQFTEWLPATILRHASAYMYNCVHQLGASKTLTPLLDASPAAVFEETCWCDLRTATADCLECKHARSFQRLLHVQECYAFTVSLSLDRMQQYNCQCCCVKEV